MQKWEYLIVTAKPESIFSAGNVNFESLQNQISELGDEGWEMVGTMDTNRNGTTLSVVLYFKRPQAS